MPASSSAVLPRVLPFAAFIAILAATPLLAGVADPRWVTALRGIAVGLLLLYFWRDYGELRGPPPTAGVQALAALAGAAVFGAWIAFADGWAVLGGAPAPGFAPTREDGSIDAVLVALRLLGFVLVVPVMEELFWRSFLLRWIAARDFLSADPRAAGAPAVAISSAVFAVEHAQWFAGLLAGLAYAGIYMLSRDLRMAILSHATTNALLATWILSRREWHLW